VYEEIGDARSSFSYTQNILYGASTNKLMLKSGPETPEADSQTPNYELAEYQTIDDAYKVSQCSAYGTNIAERSCDPCDSSAHGIGPNREENNNTPDCGALVEESCDPYLVEDCPAYGMSL
jgi:hypothetical protein